MLFFLLASLHSTMYLLNLDLDGSMTIFTDFFTFHNVSIKSGNVIAQLQKNGALHSTMYLLNPDRLRPDHRSCAPLHSTMYLLNRKVESKPTTPQQTLHSTMYLLNRECGGRYCNGYPGFTFHNVSIKSLNSATILQKASTLHSTMYLLNHLTTWFRIKKLLSLHSTMYLLNQNSCRASQCC